VLLPCTRVLQPTSVHLYQTSSLLPGLTSSLAVLSSPDDVMRRRAAVVLQDRGWPGKRIRRSLGQVNENLSKRVVKIVCSGI
jgi:hypothetical protein